MEKKRFAVLLFFSFLIVLGFFFYLVVYTHAKIQGNTVANSTNETDSHGCLIHEGFTWNQTESACVREWLSQNQSGRYQNSSNYTFPENNTVNFTTMVRIIGTPNNITSNETNSSTNSSS